MDVSKSVKPRPDKLLAQVHLLHLDIHSVNSPESKFQEVSKILAYPSWSWPKGLMPYLIDIHLEVYKTDEFIQFRLARVTKMAAIPDGRQNDD